MTKLFIKKEKMSAIYPILYITLTSVKYFIPTESSGTTELQTSIFLGSANQGSPAAHIFKIT